MRIELRKFGTTLISRQAGSEALKALQSTLRTTKPGETVEIDFTGVLTLSPGWGDEFLSSLLKQLGDGLVLLPSDNLSVHATLKILQEVNKRPFKMRS